MSPRLAGDHMDDRVAVDGKLPREGIDAGPSSRAFTDLQDAVIRQFARSRRFASRLSLFHIPVKIVYAPCTSKEMIGPHAQRGIAAVANGHRAVNLAVGQCEGIAMRPDVTAVVPEHAIAVGSSASPQPALARFINAIPESFARWLPIGGQHHGCIAVIAKSLVVQRAQAAPDSSALRAIVYRTGILSRHLGLTLRGVMRPDVSALRPRSIVPTGAA